MNPFDDATILGIVRAHSDAVDALIWRLGFEPPESESQRFIALFELLQDGNEQVVAELRSLHTKVPETSHDCYCGGCGGVSRYTGEQAPTDEPAANPQPKPSQAETPEKSEPPSKYKTWFYLASTAAGLFLVGLLVNLGHAGRAHAG